MRRLIQYPPLELRQSNPNPTFTIRQFRGVNRLDPMSIDPTFAADISNMTTSDFPVIKTRPGFSVLGSALSARVLGLYAWKNSELNAVSNGQWYKYSGGSWSAVTGGGSLNTTANWSFTNFQGGFPDINLIGANGTDPVKRYDGSTVQDLTDAPSGLNFIETYIERLWGAVKNTLHFSEYRVGTNWTTAPDPDDDSNPGFIEVESSDGQVISGIRNGPNRLIIFKPDSIYNLFGTYADAFTLKRIDDSIGAVSNQAITTINGEIYFVHRTGIFKYDGGTSVSKAFSEPVQNFVDRINSAAINKCCASTDGRMLYVGLPIDGATEPNVILEYNTEFQIWSVWRNFAPLNMTNIENTLYIGGVEGQVRKVGGLATDNGSAISGYWMSKVFGAPSYSQKVVFKRGWSIMDIESGGSVTVSASTDPEQTSGFTIQQTYSATTTIESQRVGIIPGSLYRTNFATIKYDFTGVITMKEISLVQDAKPIV
jgi:hypothetical protein